MSHAHSTFLVAATDDKYQRATSIIRSLGLDRLSTLDACMYQERAKYVSPHNGNFKGRLHYFVW